MKILYDWLKEFIDFGLTPEELRSRLSLCGIAIENLEQTPAGPLLDAELTINRPDCLSHYGMAREVAALVRGSLPPVESLMKTGLSEAAEAVTAAARVEIQCPELCGRYTARVLRGVKVGPSPDWLRRRLEALGQTSISNLVDATNYVMLEMGQPMHAFDLDRLAERRIIVRRARAGEKMRTLDGIDRVLSPDMCVIADGAQSVAIGGVMGGATSEISATTRNVLLESAWFDPISVRRTSKALGLRTEASMRFERGADQELCELSSRRCASLIRELAGGEILAGVVDVYPGRRAPLQIELTRQELLRVMGADVPDSQIEGILKALGFAPRRIDAARNTPNSPLAVWECRQPSWRQDVTRAVDLIEEVARHYGLDKFPARLHGSKQPAARLAHAEAEDRLRERLIGLGYHEIVSIPLVNEEEDSLFRLAGVVPVRVGNPLAEDAGLLRSNGFISMAHALAWNLNRGQRNVRLFEIGRIYRWNGTAPAELRVVSIGATGMAREKGPFESEREYGFADLKGDLDELGELAGGFDWLAPERPEIWQHPAQAALISLGSAGARRVDLSEGRRNIQAVGTNVIGIAAKLAPRVADRFKLRQDVFLGGFWLDPFYAAVGTALAARRYHTISRFPAVERDFSLILDEGTSFASVCDVIAGLGIGEISSLEAVDLFRGKNLPSGKFSLLVRVNFQSHTATLTEAQVNDFSARIVAALQQSLGAVLRSA